MRVCLDQREPPAWTWSPEIESGAAGAFHCQSVVASQEVDFAEAGYVAWAPELEVAGEAAEVAENTAAGEFEAAVCIAVALAG